MLERRFAEWFSRSVGMPLVVDSRWRRAKDRRAFRRLLSEKLASQFWPLERQAAQQLERVKPLLVHAGQKVPYYRDLFGELGFDPRGVRSLADLQALPVLTRQTIQVQGKRMLAEDAAAGGIGEGFTGGSTGIPMLFWYGASFYQHAEAAAWVGDMAAGRRYGTSTAYIWGAPMDMTPYLGWRGLARRWLRNEHYFDTHFMSDARLRQYHAALEALKPGMLVGFASSITELARYLEQRGLKASYPRRAVISSGEELEPDMRAALERAFPAPVFNRYGSREVGLMAYECDRHTGMHMNLSNVYLECVGADVYHAPGEILITQLHNYAMPLIRYQVDDLAVLELQPCTCGRAAPMIAHLAGRRSPSFVTSDGSRVEGYHLIRFVRRARGVLEFQLIQEAVGRMRLLLMTTPDFDGASLARARTDIADQMGADCELIVEQVERIPRPPSGKAQMLVSKLKEPLSPRTD
jgi:phenylacetate-CoA ligase